MTKAWRTLLMVLGAGLFCASASKAVDGARGWGLSPRALSLKSEGERERYTRLFEATGIVWFRARMAWDPLENPAYLANLSWFGNRGYIFLGLLPQAAETKSTGEDLSDLRRIYRMAGKLAEQTGPEVAAWESFNEPDIGFRKDLPDSSVAAMKTFYLALRSGTARNPGWDAKEPSTWGKERPVVGPSMSMPPGPWMHRAARNGLFDYCDAANFHFYGDIRDFSDVIAAHRSFLMRNGRGDLPLWLTEVGCDSVPAANPGQVEGRQKQAAFFETAAEIARAGRLATFFPYALTENKLPGLSLLNSAGEPYPAWTAYARLTRDSSLAAVPLVLGQKAAHPVVMQWVPDGASCIPHKVSGTYRFRNESTSPDGAAFGRISGRLRIYNFSLRPVEGKIITEGLSWIKLQGISSPERVAVSAGGMREFPIDFSKNGPGYCCEWVNFVWRDESNAGKSLLYFGLESLPEADDFLAAEVTGRAPSAEADLPAFQELESPSAVTSRSGCWIGLNGLEVRVEGESRKAGGDASLPVRLSLPAGQAQGPPMAVTLVKGLPMRGFLRLRSDVVFDQDFSVRVDLVDRRGQRFTIFENSGMSYFERKNEVWLNLRDFHLYFWGRCLNPFFDPSAVREIQLRPFLKGKKTAVLKVELMLPRGARPQ